jgi:hypothetical protein
MVEVRDHPGRRALEQVQLGEPRLDVRHNLHGGGTRPHERHALPAEVVLVIPPGGVEGVPLEALESRQRGAPGLAEQPRCGHEDARRERAARGFELPVLRVGNPGGAEQLAIEARVPEHVEALGAVAQVLEDLVAHRVGAVPVVARERERVEVGWDVALAARVAVSPPGAADVRAALEHHEVLDALLLEPDRHPEPAEAGAHDGHLVHVRPVHARKAIRAVS